MSCSIVTTTQSVPCTVQTLTPVTTTETRTGSRTVTGEDGSSHQVSYTYTVQVTRQVVEDRVEIRQVTVTEVVFEPETLPPEVDAQALEEEVQEELAQELSGEVPESMEALDAAVNGAVGRAFESQGYSVELGTPDAFVAGPQDCAACSPTAMAGEDEMALADVPEDEGVDPDRAIELDAAAENVDLDDGYRASNDILVTLEDEGIVTWNADAETYDVVEGREAEAEYFLDRVSERALGSEEWVLETMTTGAQYVYGAQVSQILAEELAEEAIEVGPGSVPGAVDGDDLARAALTVAGAPNPATDVFGTPEGVERLLEDLGPENVAALASTLNLLRNDSRELALLTVETAMAEQGAAFFDGGPALGFATALFSQPLVGDDFNLIHQDGRVREAYVRFSAGFLGATGVEVTDADVERIVDIFSDNDSALLLSQLPFGASRDVMTYIATHDSFDASTVDDARHGGLMGALLVHRYATERSESLGIPFEQSYDQVLQEFGTYNHIPGAYAAHLAVEAGWSNSMGSLVAGTPALPDGTPLDENAYIHVSEGTLDTLREHAPSVDWDSLVLPGDPPFLPHAHILSADLSAEDAANVLDALAEDAEHSTHPDRLWDLNHGPLGDAAELWIRTFSGNPYTETGLHQHGREQAQRLRGLAEQLRRPPAGASETWVEDAFALGLNHHSNLYGASMDAFRESLVHEYGESMGAVQTGMTLATAALVLGSFGAGAGVGAGVGGGAMTLSLPGGAQFAVGGLARVAFYSGLTSSTLTASSTYAATGEVDWGAAAAAGLVDSFTSFLGMRVGMARGISPMMQVMGGGAIDVGGASIAAIVGQPGGLHNLVTGNHDAIDWSVVQNAAALSGAFSFGFGGATYFMGGARNLDLPRLPSSQALTSAQVDGIAASLADGTLQVRHGDQTVPLSELNLGSEHMFAVYQNPADPNQFEVRVVAGSRPGDPYSIDGATALAAIRSNTPADGWVPVMGFHNHPSGSATASPGDLLADDWFRSAFGDGFTSAVLTTGPDGDVSLTRYQGNGGFGPPPDVQFTSGIMQDWSSNLIRQLGEESQQTIDALRRTWTPVAVGDGGAVVYEVPSGQRFIEYPNGDGDTNYRLVVTDEIPNGFTPILSESRDGRSFSDFASRFRNAQQNQGSQGPSRLSSLANAADTTLGGTIGANVQRLRDFADANGLRLEFLEETGPGIQNGRITVALFEGDAQVGTLQLNLSETSSGLTLNAHISVAPAWRKGGLSGELNILFHSMYRGDNPIPDLDAVIVAATDEVGAILTTRRYGFEDLGSNIYRKQL